MATPDVATMRKLQKQGKAMPPKQPGGRPRFQIRNASELDDAIRAVGRATDAQGQHTDAERAKVRRYIMSRAKALGLSSRIPGTWASDGSLKQGGDGDDDDSGSSGSSRSGSPRPAMAGMPMSQNRMPMSPARMPMRAARMSGG